MGTLEWRKGRMEEGDIRMVEGWGVLRRVGGLETSKWTLEWWKIKGTGDIGMAKGWNRNIEKVEGE